MRAEIGAKYRSFSGKFCDIHLLQMRSAQVRNIDSNGPAEDERKKRQDLNKHLLRLALQG